MNTPRLIAFTLIALLIGLIYANWDRVEYEWADATEWQRVGVAFAILFFGTIIAAWALWPFAKYIM